MLKFRGHLITKLLQGSERHALRTEDTKPCSQSREEERSQTGHSIPVASAMMRIATNVTERATSE